MLGINITDFSISSPQRPEWNPNNTGNINPSDYGSLD
jgi:hypothetical protein